MSHKYAITSIQDTDKTREELLSELRELRVRIGDLEKYKIFADNTRDIILFISRNGRILEANTAAINTYGYARDKLLSMTVYELRAFDPGHRVDEQMDKAFEVGILFETKHRRKDGSIFPVEVSSQGKYVDGNKVLLSVVRDITERKKVEDTLKFTQFALDNFRDSAMILAKDGSVVYVNQATCNSLGYTREKLLSLHLWDIDPYYTPEKLNELWPEKMKGNYSKFESAHVARDGRVFPVEVTSTYLMYGGKEYLVTFDRDITDRKQAQAALQEAKAQAELYLDLMGHDIRNMNQIGMGYLELALDSPKINKKDKELLLKSMGALENSTRLIENVRKMQKARTGELKLREVDACRAIRQVVDHYSNMPGVKVTINYDIPPACPVVANDLLYEIFENLVGNAVRHGGPEPTINVMFEATTLNDEEYYRFVVEDDGPGIPDDSKERIFNRLHKGSTKGMGLGLYLVMSLVESYHGRVWVEDRVKGDHTKGARFVVMLPASE